MSENRELQEKCKEMEVNYTSKLKEKTEKIENKYKEKIYQLENENTFFKKIINTLEKTIDKFIKWVCKKFSVSSEEEFIRDFEYENDIFINAERQIEYEELEYDDLGL